MAAWTTIRGARNLWHRFWQDSRQVPAEAWRRWGGTLAIGLGVLAVAMSLTTLLCQQAVEQGGLQLWDETQLPVLAEKIPMGFAKAVTWESPGNLIGALPVVVVALCVLVLRSHPLLAATLAMGYGLQFALVWIGWGLWSRDRPQLIADGIAAPGLHSFPSGHVVVAITIYGLLTYLACTSSRNPLERLLITLLGSGWISLIVCSRIVLGAHWPSDVIVGVVLGSGWLLTMVVALRRAQAKC